MAEETGLFETKRMEMGAHARELYDSLSDALIQANVVDPQKLRADLMTWRRGGSPCPRTNLGSGAGLDRLPGRQRRTPCGPGGTRERGLADPERGRSAEQVADQIVHVALIQLIPILEMQ